MTTAALKSNYDLALAGPVGSLDSYIQAVGGISVLSREDEQVLACRLRDRFRHFIIWRDRNQLPRR